MHLNAIEEVAVYSNQFHGRVGIVRAKQTEGSMNFQATACSKMLKLKLANFVTNLCSTHLQPNTTK